jgi:hypothetical protein
MEKAWRIKVAQAIVNRGTKEKGTGMTQDEIIDMAIEAEFVSRGKPSDEESELFVCVDKDIYKFAELVAAKAIAELERQEHNFCPRCGKRTNDIHTCTPPQFTEQDLSEQGRKKSAILGNNIEEMVNNGLPFLTALDTALKVYDHHTPRLHPPQRTWVGLTVEEIAACCMESTTTQLSFYNAIEAKLKQKNGFAEENT